MSIYSSYLYGNYKDNSMTYAIIETGGKQLRVEPGRFYDIELLSAQPDEKVTIETVLLVQHNGEVTIGQPLVAGAKVEGTVMRHLRGRKVLVYKMKPKKKTRKKRGHRQEITRLMVDSIIINGSVLASEQSATAEAQVTPELSSSPSAAAEESVLETSEMAVTTQVTEDVAPPEENPPAETTNEETHSASESTESTTEASATTAAPEDVASPEENPPAETTNEEAAQ
jgi:large subunit ribosomal protein L21